MTFAILGLDHVVLRIRDRGRMLHFYCDLLGCTLERELEDLGLIVTYSTLSLGAAYFAQLPGNYTLRPRLSTLSSLNFAEMESFHNFFLPQ